MSTIRANTLTNVANTQSIAVDRVAQGTAAAWVNFNGTGTVAIRASYNVSSITDNGVGDYTANFTTALADANYAIMGSVEVGATRLQVLSLITQLNTSVRVNTGYAGGNTDIGVAIDRANVSIAVFR